MTATVAEAAIRLHRELDDIGADARAVELVQLLASGGDARISLAPETGLNRYLSAPYPRDVLAYSSSTISDISPEAFAHLCDRFETLRAQPYRDSLNALRARIAAALDLNLDEARIAFAPSGTDLEYVALACARDQSAGGPGEGASQAVHNILLGADETGSGCVHSAHGRFFADETALGAATEPAAPVDGCADITLVDVPVRCGQGVARSSAAVSADMMREIEAGITRGCHCLVHVVHGSKTGLVLPSLSDIDVLQKRFGRAVTIVVDACQARITSSAVRAYLERGCLVLMTGSKFVGAPPFNGWALIPPQMVKRASALPQGFRQIFRRAEWPEGWPGREALEDSANLSLVLRLNAAIFELERFQTIPIERAAALIDAFESAVESYLVAALGVARVCPSAAHERNRVAARPIEMRTLITLDMSSLPGLATFAEAQALHRALALDGVRLGQPVKCVRRGDDQGDEQGEGWGGTLRVGLSMPQMIRWSTMADPDVANTLERDMKSIARAIEARVSPG